MFRVPSAVPALRVTWIDHGEVTDDLLIKRALWRFVEHASGDLGEQKSAPSPELFQLSL